MNALADKDVGDYVNEHFVTSYQKIGTFRVVNGQKQGGNVASYFCLPNGTVLHAVAGPVKADQFLQEARFAVELHKLAAANSRGNQTTYRQSVRKSHYDRLRSESGSHRPMATVRVPPLYATVNDSLLQQHEVRQFSKPAKVSALLSAYPLAKLEAFYPVVWEDVLKEQLSAAPVQTVQR